MKLVVVRHREVVLAGGVEVGIAVKVKGLVVGFVFDVG